jgi:hypothetical protein
MTGHFGRQLRTTVILAASVGSADVATRVSIGADCSASSFVLQSDVEHEGRRFALAGSCAHPGAKSIVLVKSEHVGEILANLAPSDPGIEAFSVRPLAGRTLLVYENAVEPAGNETHYIAVVDLSRDVPIALGDAWSFSRPELFEEQDAPYLGTSEESGGNADPGAPARPVIFALRESGLAQVSIDLVPRHVAEVVGRHFLAAIVGADIDQLREAANNDALLDAAAVRDLLGEGRQAPVIPGQRSARDILSNRPVVTHVALESPPDGDRLVVTYFPASVAKDFAELSEKARRGEVAMFKDYIACPFRRRDAEWAL